MEASYVDFNDGTQPPGGQQFGFYGTDYSNTMPPDTSVAPPSAYSYGPPPAFNGGFNAPVPPYATTAMHGGAYGAPAYDNGGGFMRTDFGSDPSGTIEASGKGGAYGVQGSTGYDEEPPILEELGINFEHIMQKTMSVLHPLKQMDKNIMDDTDLAGPLLFCLMFGGFLLLTGKVHFGYIYGIGVLGCLAMYSILNLMSERGVSAGVTVSVMGYCLLPMVLLSVVGVLLSLHGFVGLILTTMSIVWCTHSAAKMFVSVLDMHQQLLLVGYPCLLVYGVFALLTVF